MLSMGRVQGQIWSLHKWAVGLFHIDALIPLINSSSQCMKDHTTNLVVEMFTKGDG